MGAVVVGLTLDEHNAIVRAVEGGYFDDAIRAGYREVGQRRAARSRAARRELMAVHSAAAAPAISEFLGREILIHRTRDFWTVWGDFWAAWGARSTAILFPSR